MEFFSVVGIDQVTQFVYDYKVTQFFGQFYQMHVEVYVPF